MPGKTCEMQNIVGRVATACHLDTPTAHILEVIQKTPHFGTGHLVASRMCNDGNAASRVDPVYGVFERGPAMIDVTRFTRCQVVLKNTRNILGNTNFNHVTREMGARNEIRIAGIAHCAFKYAMNTDCGERIGHPPGPLLSPKTQCLQPTTQDRVSCVKPQADHMNRFLMPLNGNFHPIDEANTGFAGSGSGFCQTTQRIVIGQRPKIDAISCGPPSQLDGRQNTIGDD